VGLKIYVLCFSNLVFVLLGRDLLFLEEGFTFGDLLGESLVLLIHARSALLGLVQTTSDGRVHLLVLFNL